MTLKYTVYKFLMSIKGWWRVKYYFKHGKYYNSEHVKDRRFMYNKGREFFYVINKQVAPGVIFYSQDKKTYKYWEIGILDIK